MPCLKYERKIKKFNKSNTYSFYISKTKPHRPLRYEMVGYDDMLTSHYDRYILDYVTFEPWKFNRSLFNLPKSRFSSKIMLGLSVLITALKFVLLLVLSRDKSAVLVRDNRIISVKYKSWADFICRIYSVLCGSILRYGKMGNKKTCNLSWNVAAIKEL